jgi:hypothetical protein
MDCGMTIRTPIPVADEATRRIRAALGSLKDSGPPAR